VRAISVDEVVALCVGDECMAAREHRRQHAVDVVGSRVGGGELCASHIELQGAR
jgi:hypothetical protein